MPVLALTDLMTLSSVPTSKVFPDQVTPHGALIPMALALPGPPTPPATVRIVQAEDSG